MPAVGIGPVTPQLETSRVLFCPSRSSWKGLQESRVSPPAVSQPSPRLRRPPGRLGCKRLSKDDDILG